MLEDLDVIEKYRNKGGKKEKKIWATVLFDVVTFRQDYNILLRGGGGG